MTEPTRGKDRPAAQRDSEAAMERLGQQGGPFVTAVVATRMPMAITDPSIADNPIVYANSAFFEMCGYGPDEVLGRNLHFLSGPSTDPEAARMIDAAIGTGRDLTVEVRFYRKDGQPFWVMQFVSPAIGQDGQITHYFTSFFDITERKNLEDELRDAHADLERRVQTRTRELEDTNRQLHEEISRRRTVEDLLRAALTEKGSLLQEKEFLIQEVNHRVKNTLQRAQALLLAQSAHAGDQRVKEALGSAGERLARMAEIHELLHRTGGYQRIDTASYLETLGKTLLASWQGASGLVSLSVNAEDVTWGPDLVLPLGLMVNEAVSNALKHAFPERRQGTIRITLRRLSEDTHQLAIEDNGVGIGRNRREGSLGLTLIGALAQQIGGSAAVEAIEGTRVTVTFPVGSSETVR